MKNCWLLSNPRTGGNFLSQLLNRTDVFAEEFDEWLSLGRYNADNFFVTPPRCINMHYLQYKKLCDRLNRPLELLHSIVENKFVPKYVRLERSDLAAQTVSFHIAKRTNIWRIHGPRSDVRLQPQLPLDMDLLTQDFLYVSKFRYLWNEFLKNREYLYLHYEELNSNTRECVIKILNFCGVSCDNIDNIIADTQENYFKSDHPQTEEFVEVVRKMVFL